MEVIGRDWRVIESKMIDLSPLEYVVLGRRTISPALREKYPGWYDEFEYATWIEIPTRGGSFTRFYGHYFGSEEEAYWDFLERVGAV